ncbi:hypothetical protein B0H17DRAFT_1336619, partial [Mycena rosella]
MATRGLQICPHTCGCDATPEAFAIACRSPAWLGRCPIYGTAADMTNHLTRDLHHSCRTSCPLYDSTRTFGRDLTPQELEAWVPYIGHLDQFRPHIPPHFQHLVVPEGRDPSSLPHHPLFSLPHAPPAKYDEFFASFASKPSPLPKRGGTRITLGSILPDVSSTSNQTYEGFFSSYSGLRTKPTPSPAVGAEQAPSSSSVDSIAVAKRLLAALDMKPSPAPPEKSGPPRPEKSQAYASNIRVLNFADPVPQTYDDFFGPRTAAAVGAASTRFFQWNPPPGSHVGAPAPRTPVLPPPAPTPPPAPLPPPPPPPIRDLAAFERILAATSAETLRTAVLAAYTEVPAAAELFWARLSTTAAVPDGSLHLVARHQVCRHCAEEFDTADPAAQCTWHHGAAVLDPQWAPYPAPPPPPDPQRMHMYFWDCCGARLSA